MDPPLEGAANMARDQALAEVLPDGEGVLRLYRWSPPTISFGRNEPTRGLYDEGEAAREGIAFVRRPTGGRAVLHHLELTYAVVFPAIFSGGPRRAYKEVNRGLLAGLRQLGAPVELARPGGPALPPDAGPCFRAPAEGEVTALGRKLVGSAQVKMGDVVLQHGSLILDGDQEAVRRLRGDPEPVPPPATLRGLLGRVPEPGQLEAALMLGLAETLGGGWAHGEYRAEELERARALERHFADPAWTWRC